MGHRTFAFQMEKELWGMTQGWWSWHGGRRKSVSWWRYHSLQTINLYLKARIDLRERGGGQERGWGSILSVTWWRSEHAPSPGLTFDIYHWPGGLINILRNYGWACQKQHHLPSLSLASREKWNDTYLTNTSSSSSSSFSSSHSNPLIFLTHMIGAEMDRDGEWLTQRSLDKSLADEFI